MGRMQGGFAAVAPCDDLAEMAQEHVSQLCTVIKASATLQPWQCWRGWACQPAVMCASGTAQEQLTDLCAVRQEQADASAAIKASRGC